MERHFTALQKLKPLAETTWNWIIIFVLVLWMTQPESNSKAKIVTSESDTSSGAPHDVPRATAHWLNHFCLNFFRRSLGFSEEVGSRGVQVEADLSTGHWAREWGLGVFGQLVRRVVGGVGGGGGGGQLGQAGEGDAGQLEPAVNLLLQQLQLTEGRKPNRTMIPDCILYKLAFWEEPG